MKKYTSKSEVCDLEEIKHQTCGALLVFEKQLHAYRDEIYKHLADLDYLSRFLGPLADSAWKTAQILFTKTLSLIQDCQKRQLLWMR